MKSKRILITVIRVLLGLLFIFSGFTKGVDPIGSGIKLGEYIFYFGFDFLKGLVLYFAILLSTLEIVLGFMLVSGIRQRLAAAVSAVFMSVMTLFTLFIALTNPVPDCGCFGEALKLSNWATFLKNILLLLPMSLVVAFDSWLSPVRRNRTADFIWIGMFAAVSVFISVYGIRHLPMIDFLPYKKGVNIPEKIRSRSHDGETRLLYRDLQTGEVREFAITDTTWYDTSRWEYVDTVVPGRDADFGAGNFAILDVNEDVTLQLVDRPGVLFLLCVSDPAKLQARCSGALCDAAREAIGRGYRVIAITPVPNGGQKRTMVIDQNTVVEYYNIDDVVLKSFLRARAGLVVLRDGTIVDKFHCDDIPETGRFPDYSE